MYGNRGREGRGREEGRRYDKKKEDDIIPIPEFDFSDLIEKYKLTLVGRMFHVDGRSVEALIKHMPKRHIWDVEGKVRGTNLGNNKFQFDFDNEQDLQKVLQRRPCHFNKWSFSLERWIPTIKEDFPNSMLFWIAISGVPNHYKKDETYRNIGNALGLVDKVDVDGGRVRVWVNADVPLQFERRAGFANGDVIRVSLIYEELHRHCFTCKRISHEEGTCPELTEEQREKNRVARIEQKEIEEKATREAFSIPSRYGTDRTIHLTHTNHRTTTERSYRGVEKKDYRRPVESNRERSSSDLRERITERREALGKEVWKRLDKVDEPYHPRDRERYHPYQRSWNYEHRARDEAMSRNRTFIGHSNWNHKERRDGPRNHYDSHSVSRSNSGRRTSPDSQRTISDKLELQRTSRGHLDRSRKSPPKHTKEWRPIRQGKENTEAARVIETEMNDEERRRLKGKMIAQDPTPDQLRPISGRGTLIIREPSSNPPENQTEGVKRSNLGDAIQNGASKNIVETEERHSPRGSEDLELIDPDSEEDGELMDDEAFDRMIEQYTEPEQMTEADIYNVDDLMEEEQDLERTRLAKEATPTTLEEEKSKSIEKSVQNVETTICLPKRGEKSAITSQKNDETEIFKNLDQEGHQITAAKKKKKTPRSPDEKGTAASKKLAVRGRASPKGKASRQYRPPVARRLPQVPRHEVYPSAVRGKKPSVSGSVVTQKPPSKDI